MTRIRWRSGEGDLVTGVGVKVRRDDNGIHLFDRTSGLNVLIDSDNAVGPNELAPRYMSVALTNACDLSCSYCYAPKVPSRLNRRLLQGWLAELDQNGCLGVGFGGGEPTLYTDFGGLCRWVTRETSLAVTFTTHGHHLTDDLCRELRGYVHFVRVSMDGVGATYEAMRGRSFGELLQALRRVAKMAPFGVNFVVNESTIGDLDSAAEIAADVGAAELLLLLEQPTARSAGAGQEVADRMSEWIRSRPPDPTIAISSRAMDPSVPTARPFADESPLDSHAHIDASGLLKASSFDSFGIPLGASVMEGIRSLRSVGVGSR